MRRVGAVIRKIGVQMPILDLEHSTMISSGAPEADPLAAPSLVDTLERLESAGFTELRILAPEKLDTRARLAAFLDTGSTHGPVVLAQTGNDSAAMLVLNALRQPDQVWLTTVSIRPAGDQPEPILSRLAPVEALEVTVNAVAGLR